MCWNLPVFETTDPTAYVRFKQGFDSVTQAVPPEIASVLAQLLSDRRTHYGHIPVLVHVRVEEAAAGKARLLTEVRMPDTTPRFD